MNAGCLSFGGGARRGNKFATFAELVGPSGRPLGPFGRPAKEPSCVMEKCARSDGKPVELVAAEEAKVGKSWKLSSSALSSPQFTWPHVRGSTFLLRRPSSGSLGVPRRELVSGPLLGQKEEPKRRKSGRPLRPKEQLDRLAAELSIGHRQSLACARPHEHAQWPLALINDRFGRQLFLLFPPFAPLLLLFCCSSSRSSGQTAVGS